jgi:hypothetical protein
MRERSHRPDRKYAAIPNDAMRNKDISMDARGLLALMMTYSDDWHFHRDFLMEITGFGRDRFQNAMRELSAAGYVELVPIRNDGGHMAGTTWIIRDDPTESLKIRSSAESLKNRQPVKPTAGETVPLRRPTGKKTNREEDQTSLPLEADMGNPTSEAPPAEKPKDDSFVRFWAVYPKKAGKPAAQKAWAKAITKADPEAIIFAASRYAETETVARGFAKHPQGWLNDERWNDEDLKPRRDTGYRPPPDWYGTH